MQATVAALQQEGYRFTYVNLKYSPSIGQKYGVRRVPTFIYFRGGKEIRRTSGMQSAASLRRLFRDPGSFF